jgi:hypothetical protein
VVEEYLDDPGWRTAWHAYPNRYRINGAAEFIADRFGSQMASLGFLYGGLDRAKVVRSTDRNLFLYHLMLFSRHKLGKQFWDGTLEYVNPQRPLFG